MIELEKGKHYPLPLAPGVANGGASDNFLSTVGNILQILLPNMSIQEKKVLKKGIIKAGFLYDRGCLLWLFQFYDQKNKLLLTLDSPFDVRIIPKDRLALHSITNQDQRLAIELHGMDENYIVQALRLVTLPNELTLSFLAAVQDQLCAPVDNTAMNEWMQHDPSELTKKTKMQVLGL